MVEMVEVMQTNKNCNNLLEKDIGLKSSTVFEKPADKPTHRDAISKSSIFSYKMTAEDKKRSAAESRWLFACMEENDEKRKIYEERPYQVEIVEKALKENTIVCLGTGTGKTFISASVIKEMQGGIYGTYATNGKRTFFLVNTVPLVYQQAQVIKSTTCLKVGLYTGDMGVDFWNMKMWREQFDKYDVLVMTCQILVNILNHSFISLRNINLLILDECHNATKNHPYAQLLQFHHECAVEEQPHILGLTASIINKKYKRRESGTEDIRSFLVKHMKDLEVRMRSKCVTCSDQQEAMYKRNRSKPVEIIRSYSLERTSNGFEDVLEMANPEGKLLTSLYSGSKKFKDLYKDREETVDDVLGLLTAEVERIELEGVQVDVTDYSDTLLLGRNGLKAQDMYLVAADAAKYCADIISELGPLCGYDAANILIKQLGKQKESKVMEKDFEVLEECISLLTDVKTTFEECVSNSEFKKVRDIKPMEPFITKKAYLFLRDILLGEKEYFENNELELHAIVFVERRCTAVILDKLINFQVRAEREVFGGIRSKYVLGHGIEAHFKLADMCMKSNDQNKVIKEFKSGVFNVLVATSVVEEGLDVRKCNLVVRFDGIGNYRQYAQSKGRARRTISKFIIMTAEDKEKQTIFEHKIMQEIEVLLNEMCLDGHLPPSKEEMDRVLDDYEDDLIQTYYAHDGPDAARMNRNTAVGLIHRYCSMLPKDLYSSTCPHYEYTTNEKHEYQATIYLPMNFPLEEKVFQSDWFEEEKTCKKHVSLLACIALHKAGELDDNLLPVRHTKEDSDFEEDRDEMKPKEGTRKSQDYYHRKYPDAISPETFTLENSELFAISVTLVEPRDRPSSIALWPFWYGEERKGYGILLPPGIPKNLPSIKVYTRAGGIIIDFVHIENNNNSMNISDVSQFHCAMMDICAWKHVAGKYVFDINDPRVSKGLVVPLKSKILDVIHGNDSARIEHGEENMIDIDGIINYVQHGGDIGRDNDDGFKNAIINKTYLNEQQNRRLYYIAGFSDQRGRDVMEGEITYSIYYSTKYNHIIEDDAFLLEAVPCPSRVNYSEDLAKKDTTKTSTYKPERLVPELCKKAFRTHAHLHQQMNLLPYSFYLFECILNSYELRENIAFHLGIASEDEDESSVCGKDGEDSKSIETDLKTMLRQSNVIDATTKSPTIMEILETLTTRQAKFPYDLERLEMLGDSFLKQAVTVFLFFQYPKAHEGTLSSKRKKNISNKNLCRIAKSEHVEIPHVICNSQFGNVNPGNENHNSLTVWLPPGYYRMEVDPDEEAAELVMKELISNVEKIVDNHTCSESDLKTENLELIKDCDLINVEMNCDPEQNNCSFSQESEQHNLDSMYDNEQNVNFSDEDGPMNTELTNGQLNGLPHNGGDAAITTDTTDVEQHDEKNDEHVKEADISREDIVINISTDLPYQLVQDKSLADCVEALIGLYFKVGGTNLALHFMQDFLGINVLYSAISNSESCKVQIGTTSEYADFPKQTSAIQNPHSSYEDVLVLYDRMKLNRLEESIGYTFKDKSFIVQAMTHLSYTTNEVTGCYQQLEFLGDAILDFLVTLHIYMNKPELTPGELTSLRSALVNNNTFGLLVIKYEWDKYLKHLSPKLQRVCSEFLSVANDTPKTLASCFENPFVIVRENSEEGYHAPKVLGDIFESIAGAVFCDSDLNLVKTWDIFYPFMKQIIDKYMEEIPLNPIREFHERYTAGSLSYELIDDEMVVCTATYGNGKIKTGMGKNKRIAKATVCHKAVYGG